MCNGCNTVMDLELEFASLSLFCSLSSLLSDLDQFIYINACHICPKKKKSCSHNIHTIMMGLNIELGLTMVQTIVNHTQYAIQY